MPGLAGLRGESAPSPFAIYGNRTALSDLQGPLGAVVKGPSVSTPAYVLCRLIRFACSATVGLANSASKASKAMLFWGDRQLGLAIFLD